MQIDIILSTEELTNTEIGKGLFMSEPIPIDINDVEYIGIPYQVVRTETSLRGSLLLVEAD